MNSKSFYIIFFISLFYANKLSSQNLTGTWEGLMGDEYLQINIVQENDQLCGYTYDYVLNEKRNYCKAYFKGYYDKKQRTWTISGVSFIENSGSHILMHIKLWRNSGDGYDRLAGREIPKSALDFVLSLGSMESLDLKKVSAYPTPLPDNMPPCFSEEKTIKDSVVNETRPLKPADTARVIRKTNKKNTDAPREPLAVKMDTVQLIQKMSARKNTTISRLPVDVKNITLNVYDNAIVDGDTVSIFYNGRLLVNKQRLSEKPIVINLELDEKAALHEITMFAENLGSIPPNTALIVVTAGTKRYELHSSASLEENAVLIFEYKPDKR